MNDTERLLKLARLQRRVDELKKIKDEADKAYKAAVSDLEAADSGARLHFMEVYNQTGETGHPAVTAYEFPLLSYDEAAVLGAALKEAPELVKIEVNLRQREFEKAWKADHERFPWATVTQASELRLRFTGLEAMLTAVEVIALPETKQE